MLSKNSFFLFFWQRPCIYQYNKYFSILYLVLTLIIDRLLKIVLEITHPLCVFKWDCIAILHSICHKYNPNIPVSSSAHIVYKEPPGRTSVCNILSSTPSPGSVHPSDCQQSLRGRDQISPLETNNCSPTIYIYTQGTLFQ